jgi:hypothetical protein
MQQGRQPADPSQLAAQLCPGFPTAAVSTVGTATLAAFIGAGVGEPIVSGLALAETRVVFSGAVPTVFSGDCGGHLACSGGAAPRTSTPTNEAAVT